MEYFWTVRRLWGAPGTGRNEPSVCTGRTERAERHSETMATPDEALQVAIELMRSMRWRVVCGRCSVRWLEDCVNVEVSERDRHLPVHGGYVVRWRPLGGAAYRRMKAHVEGFKSSNPRVPIVYAPYSRLQ